MNWCACMGQQISIKILYTIWQLRSLQNFVGIIPIWPHATKFYTLTCYYSISICVWSENRFYFIIFFISLKSKFVYFVVLRTIASRKAHFNKSIWKVIIILNGSVCTNMTIYWIKNNNKLLKGKIPWKGKYFWKNLCYLLCNTMWFL